MYEIKKGAEANYKRSKIERKMKTKYNKTLCERLFGRGRTKGMIL